MRRKVSRRLWKTAVALSSQRGSGYAVVEAPRGPARMLILERRREEAIQRLLLAGRKRSLTPEQEKAGESLEVVTREIAEILVPPPLPYGETIVCTGVRAGYRQLKRAYTRGRLR